MKRILVTLVGVFLILLGIVGLFLPILQGWALIFLGLTLVSPSVAGRLRRRISRKFFKSGVVHLGEWKKSGVRAGFTTRHFPLIFHRTDDLLDPEKQREFAARLVPSTKFALLNQGHGDEVAVAEDADKYSKDGFYHFPQLDAALTNIPGLTLLVFTADCLSLFLSAGTWVGLVHAGWRGSQKKIAQKSLGLMVEKSGLKPDEVKIMFGPRIGAGHYEVGQEFRQFFPASSLIEKNGRLCFDLAKETRRQLLEAGARAENILDHGICTIEENGDFYSFRKEKENAGRIISFITCGL